jgi:hypothetical protein
MEIFYKPQQISTRKLTLQTDTTDEENFWFENFVFGLEQHPGKVAYIAGQATNRSFENLL